MNHLPRTGHLPLLLLAATFCAAGCHSNNQNSNNVPTPSTDPAEANLAPVSNTSGAAAPAAESSQQPAPSSEQTASSYDQSSADYDNADYGAQPTVTAPDPPPALPDYSQPPCPGDGYIWTPGYWDYASAGYYWVPGAWVQAPYQGALWTPGYWGYTNGQYGYFPGYWGTHIGFYGGINYGFGYTGVGYEGGYWNNGHFNYNREVNNVNVTTVHNVYSYRVTVRNNTRVSYNGGSNGIRMRPSPQEVAAYREPHAPPMQAQLQVRESARADHSNFASVNHGRPASPVYTRPVAADQNVHPQPARENHNQSPAERQPPREPARQPSRTETNRPEPARTQPAHRQETPQRQATPQRQEAPRREATPPRQATPQRQEAPRREATPQRQATPERKAAPQQRRSEPSRPEATPEHHEPPHAGK